MCCNTGLILLKSEIFAIGCNMFNNITRFSLTLEKLIEVEERQYLLNTTICCLEKKRNHYFMQRKKPYHKCYEVGRSARINVLSECNVSGFTCKEDWSEYIDSVMLNYTCLTLENWIYFYLSGCREKATPDKYLIKKGGDQIWYIILKLDPKGAMARILKRLRTVVKSHIRTHKKISYKPRVILGCVSNKDVAKSVLEKLKKMVVYICVSDCEIKFPHR